MVATHGGMSCQRHVMPAALAPAALSRLALPWVCAALQHSRFQLHPAWQRLAQSERGRGWRRASALAAFKAAATHRQRPALGVYLVLERLANVGSKHGGACRSTSGWRPDVNHVLVLVTLRTWQQGPHMPAPATPRAPSPPPPTVPKDASDPQNEGRAAPGGPAGPRDFHQVMRNPCCWPAAGSYCYDASGAPTLQRVAAVSVGGRVCACRSHPHRGSPPGGLAPLFSGQSRRC